MALKNLRNVNNVDDRSNVISIYSLEGEVQLALHITSTSIILSSILLGPNHIRKSVEFEFTVTLNDQNWHRLSFSFEVCIIFLK